MTKDEQKTTMDSCTTWRHDNSPNDYTTLDGWERGRLLDHISKDRMEVYGTAERFGELVALVRNI